jgi:hypothetical protein
VIFIFAEIEIYERFFKKYSSVRLMLLVAGWGDSAGAIDKVRFVVKCPEEDGFERVEEWRGSGRGCTDS